MGTLPLFSELLLSLDLEFKFDKTTRREVIQLNEREQNFSFKLDAKPKNDALGPDEWMLKGLTLREER